MSNNVNQETSDAQRLKLRSSSMGTTGLVMTVSATVGIMAAFMGAAPIVFAMSGPGAAGIYLIAGLLFLLFAIGYLAMSRRAGSASGFVAFIAKGAGPRAGVAASYVTLLTYTAVLSGIYGIYAMYVQLAAAELFGLDLPWGVWALTTLVVLGILSYNRVEFSTRLMGIVLVVAVLAVLILDAAIVIREFGNGFSFAPFSPENIFGAGFGPALLFALGSFLGVESTAVFSEEVREPRKTIPRATYIAIGVIGGFYMLSTFLVSNAVGVNDVAAVAGEDPTGFIFTVAEEYVGPFWASLLNVLVVASFFGVVLGFTNVMSRYIFALGRAGVLPAALGRSHRKHQSPAAASVVTGALIAVILLVFILANSDPFAHLYTWFLAIGTVGVLTLMFACSISVVLFFRRNRGEEGAWKSTIAPALATCAFGVAIIAVLLNFELFAGDQAFAQWLWVAVPVVAIAGLAVGSLPRYRNLNLDSIE